jgi:hypothetical protein
MAKEYFYFVSGLPVQSAEDTKLLMTPLMFLQNAKEHIDASDYRILELLLLPNDITNIVNMLHGKDIWMNESTVTAAEWAEVMEILKANTEAKTLNRKLFKPLIPFYLIEYLFQVVKSDELKPEYILYKDMFTLFYEAVKTCCNEFLRDWFRFDSDIRNITIALNSKKHNLPFADQLIGNNDLTAKLIKNQAGNLNPGSDYPMYETIARLNDLSDIIEKEKGFDALRWKWIESRIFYEYFTIPRILGYFIKLQIVYRWIHLSQSVGEKRFNQVLFDLENSFEFPEEFALNKR